MARILVTGSNRGIGLAMTQAYLERGDSVFAACRQPDSATGLQALKDPYGDQLHIIQLDVTDADSIQAAAQTVSQQTDALDVLINNAGVNQSRADQTLENITFDTFDHILRVNTAGPMMVAQAFVGLLEKGERPVLANVSSSLGSIAGRQSDPRLYAYCASKAGVNMLSKLLALELAPRGIIAIPIDPGWVQTDMGGQGASLTPAQSAAGMMRVFDHLSLEDAGTYYIHDGSTHPW